MAYIGKEPIVGNFQKCDAITVVNGQAAYTLQVSSTNVVPESANHMLVSLNGILQAPVTSFTVSSSTLTFASNLATGDVIDFVILLGNVLDLGTPSDGTVTNATLSGDLISGETDIGGAIADADLFLLDDGAGGTLRKTAASRIKTYVGSGLAEADNWRLTADATTNGFITSNWERNDANDFAVLGTGMTESSGVFSFPSTGKWLIFAHGDHNVNDNSSSSFNIYTTVDNSTYTFRTSGSNQSDSSSANITTNCWTIMNVTNTSNDKVKFQTSGYSDGNQTIRGNTAQNETAVFFIKLA